MVSHLAQYVARSPRFILQPLDNTLVRVAGPHQTPWEEGTELLDVSLTGLAFTAPPDLAPMIGEVIRIQFTPPGGNEMACHAMVVRIQKVSSSAMQVAAKFVHLEMEQRVQIAQALAKKLQNSGLIDANERTQRKLRNRLLWMFGLGMVWSFLMGALFFTKF